MPAITEDIDASTQSIKGRRKMKKAKTMKSQDGMKKWSPPKTKGSAKYRKQVIKGKKSKNKTTITTSGPRYGGA